MSFSELLKQENVDLNDKEKVVFLQKFYQEGYMQGVNDKNPNYEYSLQYRNVVERLLKLFNKTVNPIGLEQLEKGLDVMDKFYKENLMG